MAGIFEDIKNEFSNGTVLTKIIMVNIGLFVLTQLIRVFGGSGVSDLVLGFVTLPVDYSLLLLRPWTLITYSFIHGSISHIFFNMVFLYWFGRLFIEYLGEQKLLATYILGGIAAGLLSVVGYTFLPGTIAIAGASASTLAILAGIATLIPDYRVNLIFIGPVKIKYLAIVYILIDLISIDLKDNTAHIAHLGGALYGYLYIKQLRQGNDWSKGFTFMWDKLKGIFKRNPRIKVVHKRSVSDEDYNQMKKDRQQTIDRILDKISRSGYESLSKEEKDILFKMSKED